MWYCTWDAGEWTSRRKASPLAELEPPAKKRVTWAELRTTLQQVRKTETYKGNILHPLPDGGNGEICWICDIDLASGKRLSGAGKSFQTVDEALVWAKWMIDLAERPLMYESLLSEQHLDTVSVHLLPYADVMLDKQLPKATDKHKLLLKFLIREFLNQGKAKFWDYFLASAFTITSQKFLNLCKDLVLAGLVRYYRYNPKNIMSFYLGPVWLSLEGVTLKAEELRAIALGEQAANYRPWWKGTEQYPGEKYGFPCLKRDHRNIQSFYQGLGIAAKWEFSQLGNALVRIPVAQNHPTWHSTWLNGVWTHTQTPTS